MDSHAVVLGATNHPHLLDAAIWRRFPYRIELTLPKIEVRTDMWKYFLFEDRDEAMQSEILAAISEGLSGADIETISLTARRHALLGGRKLDLGAIALAIVNTRSGHPGLPQKDPLDSDQKRQLAISLKSQGEISGADIARLLDVTRQAIYFYLRSGEGSGNAR